MLVLKKENKLCLCCMEVHEVWIVQVDEKMTFSNTEVSYPAVYEYCHATDEYITTEEMIRQNDIVMKDAYREAAGVLTSQEIMDIRKKYQVSQSDLAVLLGWGKKTLTRYESHQVQDMPKNRTCIYKEQYWHNMPEKKCHLMLVVIQSFANGSSAYRIRPDCSIVWNKVSGS